MVPLALAALAPPGCPHDASPGSLTHVRGASLHRADESRAWSPDGRRHAFVRGRNGVGTLAPLGRGPRLGYYRHRDRGLAWRG